VGLATIPELDEGARGGGRDLGTQALGARGVFPMPGEAFPIGGLAREYRDARVDAHAIEGFRRHRIPLLQQVRHAEDIVPICHALLRAQRQQQGRDMPGPARVQFAQNGSCFEEAPFLQQELRRSHQAGETPLAVPFLRPLEPLIAPAELAQPLRRTCRKKTRETRRRAQSGRPRGEFLSADKLTLEKRLNRPQRRCASFFIPPSFTKSAHMRRQPQGMPHYSEQKVSGCEDNDQKNDEQVERNLGAPRMQNEQRVSAVPSHCQRKGHGERRQDKQPKQAFHCPACFRIGL